MTRRIVRPAITVAAGAALLGAAGTAAAAVPPPVALRSIDVSPVSGKVLVTVGHRHLTLRQGRRLRIGATVNVKRGDAIITARGAFGRTYSAEVAGASIKVLQPQLGTTELSMRALDGAACSGPHIAHVVPEQKMVAYAPPKRRRRRSHLAASGPSGGTFKVIGLFGTGQNVGTAGWRTTDSCNGTNIAPTQGAVSATTESSSQPVTVTAGHDWSGRCAAGGQPGVSSGYCAYVFSYVDKPFTLYKVTLYTRSTQPQADLCTTAPSAPATCQTWATTQPDASGYREASIVCFPQQTGQFHFSWSIAGVPLAASAVTYTSTQANTKALPCSGTVGQNIYPLGAKELPVPANVLLANRYYVPTTAWLSDVTVFLEPSFKVSGAESFRGVVYADDGGSPGALLGSSDAFTYTTKMTAAYKNLNFATSLQVPPGFYWLGVITGGKDQVAIMRTADTGGTGAFGDAPFAAGPPNPFGPLRRYTLAPSIYSDYWAQNPGL